jgi:hypothetical protein
VTELNRRSRRVRVKSPQEKVDVAPVRAALKAEGTLTPWFTTSTHYAFVKRGGRMLMLAVSGFGPHDVFAIETTSDTPDYAKFFADHSHAVVGEDLGVEAAKALAEDYARRWVAGEVSPAPACGCEEIVTPATGNASR